MAKFLFSNLASAQLAVGAQAEEVSLSLVAGQGALFPTPGSGERFSLVLRKPAGEVEIMHCWRRIGDILDVLRGQEGTTPLAWSMGDWASNRTTAQALNAWASVDVGALAVDANHIFDDNAARDTYFAANPDELEAGVYIAVGSDFQRRETESWSTITALLRGPQGPIGDVTQAALNAVADAETYANTVLQTNALAYDPDTVFYDFPMVCVGSDSMTYRATGDDVTALDIGSNWTVSGSGTAEYYYTGANIPATKPDRLGIDGDLASEGTLGGLAASTGEWAWGDNDTLGANTFYVRLADDTDPDTKPAGYIKYRNDLDPTA